MKILVAIKRVTDANVKVRPKSDGSGMELNNVKMAINPFCEIAIEEAVRLKEAGTANEIIVVSVGSKSCQEQLCTALALGADRGIQIDATDDLKPLAIAKCLQKIVVKEEPSIVLLGKQTIDNDNNQIGQMLAALCDMPQGTFASDIKVENDHASVIREIDGGFQTVRLSLPAVVTTDLRLNKPRYVKLTNIMKAKNKPLDVITTEELGVNTNSNVKTLRVEYPAKRQAGIKVENVAELIDKLKNEAKVI